MHNFLFWGEGRGMRGLPPSRTDSAKRFLTPSNRKERKRIGTSTVFTLRRAKNLLDQLVSWVHCDKALGEWKRITLFQEMTKCLSRQKGGDKRRHICGLQGTSNLKHYCREMIQRQAVRTSSLQIYLWCSENIKHLYLWRLETLVRHWIMSQSGHFA